MQHFLNLPLAPVQAQATVRLGSRLCRFCSLSLLIHAVELLSQTRAYETLCNIFRFMTNVSSFRFHLIFYSNCINPKLPILPHFHMCWLKKLTTLGKLHVSQPNQNHAFSFFDPIHYLSVHLHVFVPFKKVARINIEMILMDEKADRIVAQIENVDPGKWNDVVKMGKTYMNQNFEVEKNTGQFRPTKHVFKLNFVNSTKDFLMIPEMVYDFTLFNVLTGSANPDYLIDVVGELVDVLQWGLDGKPKKVVFTMKDNGTIVNCTLWEDFSFLLKDYLHKHQNGPIILLLHLAKIKEAQDVPSTCATKNVPSNVLRQRILREGKNQKNSQVVSPLNSLGKREGRHKRIQAVSPSILLAKGESIPNSMYGCKLFISEDLKDIEDYKNG
ncbi:hypothetical protein HKD37_06G016711 [Glycine soja]